MTDRRVVVTGGAGFPVFSLEEGLRITAEYLGGVIGATAGGRGAR